MIRTIVFCLLSLLLPITVSSVQAQQQKKVPRVGYLSGNSLSGDSPRVDAFRQGLHDLGYIEGQNIAIEYRYADGQFDHLPALLGELMGLKLDLLVTATTNAAVAAKNATRTVPIVFVAVTDPVAAGLIDSLARPGGNITGVTNIASVLVSKRLELLKGTVSKLSRVAVFWDPQNPGSAQEWKESQVPAQALGLELHSMKVTIADQLEEAFKEAVKAHSAALAVTLVALAVTNARQIVDLATKDRLPAIYPRAQFVDAGGLMSYGPSLQAESRAAARLVDDILKGSKSGELPVEQPMKFEFAINLKAAKQIGLIIPPNVLARADKVIR